MIAMSVKQVETRSWTSPHRGPLAIHAAKWKTDEGAEEVWTYARENKLVPADAPVRARDLPTGVVIATCELVAIEPVSACGCSNPYVPCPRHGFHENEFGSFEAGRFFWTLEAVKPLTPPVPFRGMQGLFEWPASGEARAVEVAHQAREKKQGEMFR